MSVDILAQAIVRKRGDRLEIVARVVVGPGWSTDEIVCSIASQVDDIPGPWRNIWC